MSLTESFNPPKHTPLYENKQNEREILQSAEILKCSSSIMIVGFVESGANPIKIFTP